MFLEKQHWSVRGLVEPNGQLSNTSSLGKALQELVPTHLEHVIKHRFRHVVSHGFRHDGLSLRGLAAIASLLEELTRQEANNRVDDIYKLHNFDKAVPLSQHEARIVMDTYMYIFMEPLDFNPTTGEQSWRRVQRYQEKKPAVWNPIAKWLQEIKGDITGSDDGSTMDHQTVLRMTDEIGKKYARAFYDVRECQGLKKALLEIESNKPGRVKLSAFYNQDMSGDGRFSFNEKVGYLRDVGALDESIATDPSVIIPNYIAAPPNCLNPSTLYSICCPNECDGLLTHIEGQTGAPRASPDKVVGIVEALPSSTVTSPRKLAQRLLVLLRQVAEVNGGDVPLHGRLFTQWMHHSYPRECAFPHEAGTTRPQSPDEWARGNGHARAAASEEEMVCHVSGNCVGGAKADYSGSDVATSPGDLADLPWTNSEELHTAHRPPRMRNVFRTMAQMGALLSMIGAFLNYLWTCTNATQSQQRGRTAAKTEIPTWTPRISLSAEQLQEQRLMAAYM
jgi:hypothetical protein